MNGFREILKGEPTMRCGGNYGQNEFSFLVEWHQIPHSKVLHVYLVYQLCDNYITENGLNDGPTITLDWKIKLTVKKTS